MACKRKVMEFIRFGRLNQKSRQTARWHHAPAPTGIWAFPYPYHRVGRHGGTGIGSAGYLLSSTRRSYLKPDGNLDMRYAERFHYSDELYTHLGPKPVRWQRF